MRKLLLSFTSLLAMSAFAADIEMVDLAKDAATVFEFQSAVAQYEEDKAMSFIAPHAELIFKLGDNPEQKFSGIDQIKAAYAKNWFQVPSKMLKLDEANFSRTQDGKFRYAFKGEFAIKDGDEWRNSMRESVSYFTVENGRIVMIERIQERPQS